MAGPYLIVLSAADPVATAVEARWGTLASTGQSVDGAPIRRLPTGALVLRRPGLHVTDERLDRRLPGELAASRPTLVFPSIHRSEQGVECLTVHPLGNPGPTAEVGGRPRTLNPTDPALMTATFRALSERSVDVGVPATFEATHHGPELGLPSFFVEIGFASSAAPPAAAVRALADLLPSLDPRADDHVALGVGGGHYAPHFSELARRRRWAFGHILSRHALLDLDAPTARAAWDGVPAAEGVLYARSADAQLPALAGLGPRLRDGIAPARLEPVSVRDASRPASGT